MPQAGMTAALRAAGRLCMKGQATLIRKLALGAVCILLAAGFTLLLKEVLDTQEPEQALPILEVRCKMCIRDRLQSAHTAGRPSFQQE